MTHASLFSGIGGFDLAAEWAGFTNVFHCEIDPFCQKVLNHHFPNSISYENVKTTDFAKHRGEITVLSGGFPCQPFSVAGKRKGANDDRYLWPEMLRAIREIKPTWVIAENVNGITGMVLPSQKAGVESEATDGETDSVSEFVVERICKELEGEGYSVRTLVIPACGVEAPHQRYRVWFLAHRTDSRTEAMQQAGKNGILPAGSSAHANSHGRNKRRRNDEWQKENTPIGTDIFGKFERLVQEWTASYSDGIGPQERKEVGSAKINMHSNGFDGFPTQSPVCSRDDGLSSGLDAITFPRWRKESIKAYGNAIVPQVAYLILKMIIQIERL